MTETAKTYTIERTCSRCGHKDKIEASKREAAFELVDINILLGNACNKCSSSSFATSYKRSDLDYELLKEWATDPELFLMEQDEEILLADGQYVDSILDILDTVSLPKHKTDVLMDALCIIVYDNSINDNDQPDIDLKKRVIDELNKRQDKLKAADKWIMDYIKDVVYPQLQFDGGNAL